MTEGERVEASAAPARRTPLGCDLWGERLGEGRLPHRRRPARGGYWLGQVCDEVIMDALATDFSSPSAITLLLLS